MRTRIAIVAILFALLVWTSVLAADKPGIDIPLYPSGEATMEINLTSDDLIPTLQAMLPMVAGKIADKISPDDLAAALKDVKRVEMLQVDITKTATEAQVVDYYAKNLPTGQWNRVFWQKWTKGTMVFYIQGGGEMLYGFRVQQAMADGKPIKRVQIVKTEGKIDFVKVLTIAGKVFMP